jgi:hypothetical protein
MPGIDPTLLARICLGLALSIAITLAICELLVPRSKKEESTE